MKIRRSLLAVACCAMLAACGTAVPAPGTAATGGGAPATAAAVSSGQPTSSPAAGPGQATQAPAAGPSGTIRGTIEFEAHGRTEDAVSHQVTEHRTTASINVRLVLDPAAGIEQYIDDGSTYSVDVLITTEFPGANCTATSRSETTEQHAFTDMPTSYENDINAAVLRDEGLVLISAMYSWTLRVTGNACDGRSPTTVETAGGLDCPFGLMAKLIEGAATDTIDTACTLPGGETYSGILTLAH